MWNDVVRAMVSSMASEYFADNINCILAIVTWRRKSYSHHKIVKYFQFFFKSIFAAAGDL